MAGDSEKASRHWIAWLVVGVWVSTAFAVLIAARIHPATTVNLSLHTRKISFRTNASQILGQSDEEQLLVSGVSLLQIQFSQPQSIRVGNKSSDLTSLDAQGDSLTSCSFYRVRSQGFEVRDPAVITLQVNNVSKTTSFSLTSHGALNDNLSSLPSEKGLQPGFECTGLHIQEGPSVDVEGHFSSDGGDTLFLATPLDTRLDFSVSGHSGLTDTQIPIVGEVRFSEIEPGESEEKSVLLPPAPEIAFEDVNKKITLDPADLLVVIPKGGFYLRQFTVKDGIQLSLHGRVGQLLAGAGAHDLATLMPSAFDRLNNSGRIYAAIPAIVGLILGILEKIGVLGKK
jgi:hypothetical protein